VLIRLVRSGIGRRLLRVVATLLAVAFGVLAVLFLLVEPFLFATDVGRAATPPVLSAAGGSAFLLMFLLSFVLGLTLLSHPEHRPVAVILLAVAPVLGLTILAGGLGSDFAHPGYAETLVNFGVALLARPAVAVPRDRSRSELQSASPAS
jgi:quinol-cytochrome oxidoreductase complex cytochrome b subunit